MCGDSWGVLQEVLTEQILPVMRRLQDSPPEEWRFVERFIPRWMDRWSWHLSICPWDASRGMDSGWAANRLQTVLSIFCSEPYDEQLWQKATDIWFRIVHQTPPVCLSCLVPPTSHSPIFRTPLLPLAVLLGASCVLSLSLLPIQQ